MSNLENAIIDLERQLALKKAYQAAKIVLPKGTPADVAEEVQDKLREFACGMAMDQDKPFPSLPSSDFSAEQLDALKMIADATIARSKGGTPPPAGTVPGSDNAPKKEGATPGGSSEHKASFGGRSRKAKILVADNVRGEARKYAAPDDEIFIPNSEKTDDHGMVSATHMRKGMMMKIPVDDIEYLD